MRKRKKKHHGELTARQKAIVRERYQNDAPEAIARSLSVPPAAVQAYIDNLQQPLTAGKRAVFSLLLVLLPIALLGVTELALRLAGYGSDTRLFVPAEFDPRYMIINRGIGARYFVAKQVIPAVSYNYFLKEKPANSYRVFVLGGSSAAGYPYLFNGAFSQMLKTRLQDYFPDKIIEMVNVAMPAVNSYTLLDLADEILPWQPDAFLIYAGHNEFYGALGAGSSESLGQFRFLINLFLKLQDYKSFLLLKNAIGWLMSRADHVAPNEAGEHHTLMERMVRDQEIPLGSPKYLLARRNFIANLRDIIDLARTNGVRVLLSDLVSNVRDQPPFVSIFDPKADGERWQALFDDGQVKQNAGDFAAAIAAYRQAAAVDSTPAILYYRLAQCFEYTGDIGKARVNYYRAKDLDGLRFRASEDFNAAIHELGAAMQTPVVPMREAFEAASPHGLIGDNLMLEHLHPNVDGYFLMAKAFCRVMRAHGFISAHWDERRARPDSVYRQEIGVTALDHKVTEIRISVLKAGWPFQPKSRANPLSDFRPLPERPSNTENELERVALAYWKGELTWERAHVQMAEYYEKLGELDLAAAEYRALIQYMPINVSPYLRLAHIYLAQSRFDALQQVLRQTLPLEETAFARKWLGILALKNGDATMAAQHLERAYRRAPDDLQTMYNLCGAYALSGRLEEARELTEKLLARSPNHLGARNLLLQLQRRQQ